MSFSARLSAIASVRRVGGDAGRWSLHNVLRNVACLFAAIQAIFER